MITSTDKQVLRMENEEKRIDLTPYVLESKVKKIFHKHFRWWEKLSLREVKDRERQIKIRKSQMEEYYGLVEERIEAAKTSALEKILNAEDHIEALHRILRIEPYLFVKDEEKSAYI